jgi:transcriptional regulator with PAS, ATPase and Fis domain
VTAPLEAFTSADPAMQRCLTLARHAAATDLPVLILGESGTGKTMLARALHNSSRRSGGPFVSFNAAALSDTLLDSQLFGHERGAFTGAQRSVKGRFELAHGGSLLIDEIADMSPSAQAKILRAVEHGEFQRLGAERIQTADVRLLSATCLPIRELVAAARFRKDLFYRIAGITIAIPPLRERPADLRALIASEIAHAAREEGRRVRGLDREAAARLLAYPWPGNLRELNRVIRAAVALSTGDVVTLDAIEPVLGALEVLAPSADAGAPDGDLRLDAAVRRHVLRVLERTGGRKRQAARWLGVSRATLERKLRPRGSQS